MKRHVSILVTILVVVVSLSFCWMKVQEVEALQKKGPTAKETGHAAAEYNPKSREKE
ncbi:hypothetical protein [Listeria fleischmannii]|uniref:hypothetical protein n=1 Tax=Listeria fleischmannii TaxID=1069827 RepID=UPI0004AC5E70|nr:hypothetical protein [Listeria fleischmannii]